ncbi:hypothetical protein BDR26DRAFT_855788 [Obelidium mucronatum]|nr:hypothetical protein BDR26DRAFT_855788 [Obelidium mucronatum]
MDQQPPKARRRLTSAEINRNIKDGNQSSAPPDSIEAPSATVSPSHQAQDTRKPKPITTIQQKPNIDTISRFSDKDLTPAITSSSLESPQSPSPVSTKAKKKKGSITAADLNKGVVLPKAVEDPVSEEMPVQPLIVVPQQIENKSNSNKKNEESVRAKSLKENLVASVNQRIETTPAQIIPENAKKVDDHSKRKHLPHSGRTKRIRDSPKHQLNKVTILAAQLRKVKCQCERFQLQVSCHKSEQSKSEETIRNITEQLQTALLTLKIQANKSFQEDAKEKVSSDLRTFTESQDSQSLSENQVQEEPKDTRKPNALYENMNAELSLQLSTVTATNMQLSEKLDKQDTINQNLLAEVKIMNSVIDGYEDSLQALTLQLESERQLSEQMQHKSRSSTELIESLQQRLELSEKQYDTVCRQLQAVENGKPPTNVSEVEDIIRAQSSLANHEASLVAQNQALGAELDAARMQTRDLNSKIEMLLAEQLSKDKQIYAKGLFGSNSIQFSPSETSASISSLSAATSSSSLETETVSLIPSIYISDFDEDKEREEQQEDDDEEAIRKSDVSANNLFLINRVSKLEQVLDHAILSHRQDAFTYEETIRRLQTDLQRKEESSTKLTNKLEKLLDYAILTNRENSFAHERNCRKMQEEIEVLNGKLQNMVAETQINNFVAENEASKHTKNIIASPRLVQSCYSYDCRRIGVCLSESCYSYRAAKEIYIQSECVNETESDPIGLNQSKFQETWLNDTHGGDEENISFFKFQTAAPFVQQILDIFDDQQLIRLSDDNLVLQPYTSRPAQGEEMETPKKEDTTGDLQQKAGTPQSETSNEAMEVLERKTAKLEKAISILKDDQIEELKAQLLNQETVNRSIQDQVSKLLEDNVNLHNLHEKNLELEDSQQELDPDHLESLKKQISSLQKDLLMKETEIGNLIGVKGNLLKQLESEKSSVFEMSEKADVKCQMMQRQLNEFKITIESQNIELDQFRKERMSYLSSSDELFLQKVSGAASDTGNLEQKVEKLEQTCIRLREKNREVVEQLESARLECYNLKESLSECQIQLQSCTNELEKLSLAPTTNMYTILIEQLEASRLECFNANEKIETQGRELQNANKELEFALNKLTIHQHKLETKELEAKKYKEESISAAGVLKKQISTLRESLDGVTKELHELQETVRRYSVTVKSLESERQVLQEEIKSLTIANQQSTAKIQELQLKADHAIRDGEEKLLQANEIFDEEKGILLMKLSLAERKNESIQTTSTRSTAHRPSMQQAGGGGGGGPSLLSIPREDVRQLKTELVALKLELEATKDALQEMREKNAGFSTDLYSNEDHVFQDVSEFHSAYKRLKAETVKKLRELECAQIQNPGGEQLNVEVNVNGNQRFLKTEVERIEPVRPLCLESKSKELKISELLQEDLEENESFTLSNEEVDVELNHDVEQDRQVGHSSSTHSGSSLPPLIPKTKEEVDVNLNDDAEQAQVGNSGDHSLAQSGCSLSSLAKNKEEIGAKSNDDDDNDNDDDDDDEQVGQGDQSTTHSGSSLPSLPKKRISQHQQTQMTESVAVSDVMSTLRLKYRHLDMAQLDKIHQKLENGRLSETTESLKISELPCYSYSCINKVAGNSGGCYSVSHSSAGSIAVSEASMSCYSYNCTHSQGTEVCCYSVFPHTRT